MGQIFVQPQHQTELPWGAYAASRNRGGNDVGAAMMAEIMRGDDNSDENALLAAVLQMIMQQMGNRESNALALQLAQMQDAGADRRSEREMTMFSEKLASEMGLSREQMANMLEVAKLQGENTLSSQRIANEPVMASLSAADKERQELRRMLDESQKRQLVQDAATQYRTEEQKKAATQIGQEAGQKAIAAKETGFKAGQAVAPNINRLRSMAEKGNLSYAETQQLQKMIPQAIQSISSTLLSGKNPQEQSLIANELLPQIDEAIAAMDMAQFDFTPPIQDASPFSWVWSGLRALAGKEPVSGEKSIKEQWKNQLESMRYTVASQADPAWAERMQIETGSTLAGRESDIEQKAKELAREMNRNFVGIPYGEAVNQAGTIMGRYEASGPASAALQANPGAPTLQNKVVNPEDEEDIGMMLMLEQIMQEQAMGGR